MTTGVERKRGPNLLIRFVWWLFIGWWASGIVVGVAWLALITIIGIPLALILLPLYVALLFLGWITAALFLGRKGLSLARPAASTSGRGPQMLAFLLAVVALWLLGQVPFVGGWVKFAALVLGMGALVWQLGSARRSTAPGVT